ALLTASRSLPVSTFMAKRDVVRSRSRLRFCRVEQRVPGSNIHVADAIHIGKRRARPDKCEGESMLPRRRLVGRCWAVARIAGWYRSSEPALVVTGAAGTGKTALVTSLAERPSAGGVPDAVRAVHRCRSHVIASTDPIRVPASIAEQLARTVPDYASTLTRLRVWERDYGRSDPATFAKCVALDSTSPSVAYERVLRWPFREVAGARRGDPDIVVVVDGLDEGTPELAGLLSECLQSPVPGLRLLLTTRPGPAL